jgi:YgiT-type zinc finger domain-containing protein
MTRDTICNYCGHSEYVQKKVEYVYRHKGHYMVFQDVPAEVCLHCGTRYYDADVILVIEKRFMLVKSKQRKPERTISVPVETFG